MNSNNNARSVGRNAKKYRGSPIVSVRIEPELLEVVRSQINDERTLSDVIRDALASYLTANK